jgi:hypothetical protein
VRLVGDDIKARNFPTARRRFDVADSDVDHVRANRDIDRCDCCNSNERANYDFGSVDVHGRSVGRQLFSLYANGTYVGEDSVPITTERSFNAETITFTGSYPLTIAMVTKDFKENDTGLEYIGTNRQQMGDAGFIAQITDTATGKVVAATNTTWRGLVIHQAPTNKECAKSPTPATVCKSIIGIEPAGWAAAGFDDAAWPTATAYTEAEVGTKDGYNTISWNPSAALIWSSDLVSDNTVLWRTTIR